MTSRPLTADLHVHSTASDGTLTPRAVVTLAADAGLSHLALTDHDSVDGIAEAARAAAGLEVSLIPGVELSAVTDDGQDVHILGYFLDPASPSLLATLAELRRARERRAKRMVRSLADAGIPVELDRVIEFAGEGAIGRAHLARAIVASGHATTVADAFDRLIGRGGPHYVSKESRTPSDALACIAEAGGIAVIAHPGVGDHLELIRTLASKGLAGIEAFHADHTLAQRQFFAALARDLGLLATGGSDFHGPDGPNPPLGSVHLPPEHLEAFLAARPR